MALKICLENKLFIKNMEKANNIVKLTLTYSLLMVINIFFNKLYFLKTHD